ncbi:unnamed protein product [marine sediment metagenome]|uniref:Uncharacterized protein n=1 Tax=marine sediment metagenome TaxID=412755 RepID=X1RKT3_9ZZZZ
MLVVGIYNDSARNFKGLTIVDDWKSFTRRLRYYFSDVNKVKDRIIGGEIIELPYITLQRDRRCQSIKVKDERRQPVKAII